MAVLPSCLGLHGRTAALTTTPSHPQPRISAAQKRPLAVGKLMDPLQSPGLDHNRPTFSIKAGQAPPVTDETQRESSVNAAKSLDNVEVLDLNGNRIPVTDLWKDRRAVVGFTRHFGCVLCMKRADLLASRKMEMDAANVSLIIIGPGNVEQAQAFVEKTKFPGEVYADPNHSTHEAFAFASGIGSTFSPTTGMRIISAYLEGYRQDWGLSFQKDTVSKGGWQQGGVLVAGPGKDCLSYLFRDMQAGDEPDMDNVVAVCCST